MLSSQLLLGTVLIVTNAVFHNNFDRSQNNTKKSKWDYVQNIAAETPVGNLGLIMIPFLGGAGAPYWNMDARGALQSR